MNKHGQSLIIFILLLPVLVMMFAFMIDSGKMIIEKSRIENILEDNMQIFARKNIRDIERIKEVLLENDRDLKLDIKIENNILYIDVGKENKSLFGNIFSLPMYRIDFHSCVDYQSLKWNKECGDKK